MSSPTIPAPTDSLPEDGRGGTSRRRFLAYLVAAPTLAVGVSYAGLGGVANALPGTPEIADAEDLGDFLIQVQKPTESQLILLQSHSDGSVSCALPRMEVGQGLTTSVAMLIADELALPLSKVKVTLADARPELLFGQITGGSNTIRSIYDPVKAAGAAFRGRMAAAAAAALGVPVDRLRIKDGGVLAPDGRSLGFGELATAAAAPSLLAPADAALATGAKLVGTEQRRVDAHAMVTGAFKYTNDLEPVAGLLRSMVRRAPHIRGSVKSIDNLAAVKRMPGVVDVFVVDISKTAADNDDLQGISETGVAVVAETFGQALDAKEALVVTWNPGPLAGMGDDDIKKGLRNINPGLSQSALPALPALPGSPVTVVEGEFDFAFVSHAPLESNTAIAHVRGGKCDVWSGMKIPIVAAQTIADELGLDAANVTAHVVQGGGSFGRRLFFDGAIEAARISQKAGKPVKHMFTRIDDMRHGRARSASFHRVRLVAVGKEVAALQHNAAFVETDWRHGLGEVFSAYSVQENAPQILPPSVADPSIGGNLTFSESVFYTTVKSPYDFGATVQSIQELALPFNTAAWRSVYSPNTRGAEEVMVDELAAELGEDAGQFRLDRLSDARHKAVLKKALEMSGYGRTTLPKGHAQGIGFHAEYKSAAATVVQIDATDPQKPRVTHAWTAADYGVPINPLGLKSQLLGGLTDGIATTLRAGLHLDDGLFLEGSYSQFHFPRNRDIPTHVDIHIFPKTSDVPGGAGELGVTPAVGAVANAYARATGKPVRSFPIIFPVDFTPFTKNTGSTRRPSNLPPKK